MFDPLKIYFGDLDNCPVSVRRFFEDKSSLFWLHFLDSQLQLSNEYVLSTEGKKIAAFEVEAEVAKLRNKIGHREENKFIPVNAKLLFNALSKSEKSQIRIHMKKFYTCLSTYLRKWSQSLDGAEIFNWMNLTSVPDWEKDVEPSIGYVIEHTGSNVVIEGDKVFDEINLLRDFVSDKLQAWTDSKASSESRWLEIFAIMNQQQRPLRQISLLVQYAFAIPGSSTEVERLFSVIGDIWGPKQGHMSMETLDAYLNVKVNSDLNCSEYYASVKNNRRLLSQVHSNQKYKKNNQSSTSLVLNESEESDENDN